MKISTEKKLNKLRERLQLLNPDLAILFGSAARGQTRPSSDLDIIVVMETDRRFLDRLGDVLETLDLDFQVDVLVYTPEEFEKLKTERAFVRKAVKEGRIIYEKRLS